MAVIKPVILDVSPQGDQSCISAVWSPVTEADTCNPIEYPKLSDKSVVVTGTFGSASIAIQGSNDRTNFAALHDSGGTVIAITVAGAKQILENTLQIKPVTSGGTASSLTIGMMLHMSNPMRT